MNLRHALSAFRSTIRKRTRSSISPERTLIIALALALMFSLGVQMGQAQGRAPVPAPALSPAAPATAFADSIPIQGRLTNASGSPLTGSFAMTFNIYNVPVGGPSLCTSTNPAVAVANGLWNATIDGCGGGSGLFAGGDTQLYVGIQVGADPEMTPRQPLRAVPYAQGLMTPLEVSGTSSSAILTVVNGGSGRAANFTGDVAQGRTNSGLVKAAALVYCASASSLGASVYRYFNNVNNSAVTITGGASSGKCTVDFGFQVSGVGNTGRYYVASPRANLFRAVSCGENVTNTKLDCNYFDLTGAGIDGDIEILIY